MLKKIASQSFNDGTCSVMLSGSASLSSSGRCINSHILNQSHVSSIHFTSVSEMTLSPPRLAGDGWYAVACVRDKSIENQSINQPTAHGVSQVEVPMAMSPSVCGTVLVKLGH